jgi:hypothetical protein
MFRSQEISATDARKYFSQLIHKVQFGAKSFTIKTYRRPAVRIVREEYIAALEQVVGKKTINQVLEIAGNENIPDFIKVEQIKKTFQRRLSGQPQQPRPQRPRPATPKTATQKAQRGTETRKNVVAKLASPTIPKPQQTKPKSQPPAPRPKNPNPQHIPNRQKGREVLLLSNGKNYQ